MKTYIFITENDGIVYKRMVGIVNGATVKLNSDNPVYPSLEIPMAEIKEAWKAVAYISTEFPENEMNLS